MFLQNELFSSIAYRYIDLQQQYTAAYIQRIRYLQEKKNGKARYLQNVVFPIFEEKIEQVRNEIAQKCKQYEERRRYGRAETD